MVLKIYRLNRKNPLPRYMTSGASGVDLFASLDKPVEINPGEYSCIPSGIIVSLSEGYEAQVRPRSGLALKSGVTVLNAPGTVDSDYRGEVKVILINHGKKKFTVSSGMRIAQMIILPVEKAEIVEVQQIEQLDITERNIGGFGHTGV